MNFDKMPQLQYENGAPTPTSGSAPETKNDKKEKVDFVNFVELNKQMTVLEAVKILAEFHGTSDQNVLNAFMNLRNDMDKEGYTAVFQNSINNSTSCLSVVVNGPDGHQVSSSKMDKYTGQPMAHIG